MILSLSNRVKQKGCSNSNVIAGFLFVWFECDGIKGLRKTLIDIQTKHTVFRTVTPPFVFFFFFHYVTFQKQPGEHPGRAVIYHAQQKNNPKINQERNVA